MRILFGCFSTKKMFVMGLIVFGFAWMGWLRFPSLFSVCHSFEIRQEEHVSEPVFLTKTEVAFMKFFTTYREPVGICTFPNGGTRLVVKKQIQLYKVRSNGSYELLFKKLLPKEIEFPPGVEIANMFFKEGKIYMWLLFDSSEVQRLYYVFDLSTMKFDDVDINSKTVLVDENWQMGRFHSSNFEQIIDYDSDVGIALFTGGPLEFDIHSQQVVQRGGVKTLVSLWLPEVKVRLLKML